MSPKNKPLPVAIVVGGEINGLGVVRSLAAVGIPCVVVDADPRRPAMRSKLAEKKVIADIEGEPLLQFLLEFAANQTQKPILFLTEEGSVRTVSKYRDRLVEHLRFRMPSIQMVSDLMNKPDFQRIAEEHGLPVPKSLSLSIIDDLAGLDELHYPCILKPSYKNYDYGARFKKGYKVNNVDEARELYLQISPTQPEMIIQEWIEGGDDDIYFCLQYRGEGSRIFGSFCGRKVRSWPPRVGGTASCTMAEEAAWPELERISNEFFDCVAYEGMGGVEFKYDRDHQRFVIIEPTVCRTDVQHEVGLLNGFNLPACQYFSELGLEMPPIKRKNKKYMWRDPISDRWSSEHDDPDDPPETLNSVPVNIYFRWSDPTPWVDVVKDRIARKLNAQLVRSR